MPLPSQPDPDENVKNPKHKPTQYKAKREAKNAGTKPDIIEEDSDDVGEEDTDLWTYVRHRIRTENKHK